MGEGLEEKQSGRGDPHSVGSPCWLDLDVWTPFFLPKHYHGFPTGKFIRGSERGWTLNTRICFLKSWLLFSCIQTNWLSVSRSLRVALGSTRKTSGYLSCPCLFYFFIILFYFISVLSVQQSSKVRKPGSDSSSGFLADWSSGYFVVQAQTACGIQFHFPKEVNVDFRIKDFLSRNPLYFGVYSGYFLSMKL